MILLRNLVWRSLTPLHLISHSRLLVHMRSMTALSYMMKAFKEAPQYQQSRLTMSVSPMSVVNHMLRQHITPSWPETHQLQHPLRWPIAMPRLTQIFVKGRSIIGFFTPRLIYRPFSSSTGSVTCAQCGISSIRTPISTASLPLHRGRPRSPSSTPCKACQLLVSSIRYPL